MSGESIELPLTDIAPLTPKSVYTVGYIEGRYG